LDVALELPPGERRTLDARMSQGGALRGRVGSAGKPVWAYLTGYLVGGDPLDSFSAWSAADGTYEAIAREAGEYDVAVSVLGYEYLSALIQRVNLTPSTVTQRDFELPAGALSGQVLGNHGDPVSLECVFLRQERSSRRAPPFEPGSAIDCTDLSGRFHFPHLSPGTYELAAYFTWTPGGAVWKALRPFSRKLVIPRDGSSLHLTLQPGLGSRVEGTVRFSNGVLVRDGTRVFLRAAHERAPERTFFHPGTRGGRFRIEGLAPGTYRLWAGVEDAERGAVDVTIGDGASVEVSLTAEPTWP
jgi:hypothetical protein